MISDIRRVTSLETTIVTKIIAVVFNPCLWAIACYRMAHRLWRWEFVIVPRLLSVIGRMVSGIDISPEAFIGHSLLILHGSGVVIEPGTHIGSDVTIYQGVGLGRRFSSANDGPPEIGDGVTIYAGAKVLGPIHIGDRCRIGANAVVLRSFPADVTLAGIPACSVARRHSTIDTISQGSMVFVDTRAYVGPKSVGALACYRKDI